MNNVSIIIVHWNTPEKLKSSLYLDGMETIVVDNNSTASLSWLTKKFPEVILIKNSRNTGFASACNRGVLEATCDWLLFLNPDVGISKPLIQKMRIYAEKNNLDACCPRMGKNYNKPLPSMISLIMEFTPLNKLSNLAKLINFPTLKTLFGGCLLIKKKALMDIGGFDERFFLWFEDSDLTKRLIDKKYTLGIAPIKINHEGGASFIKLGNQLKRDIFFNSMEIYARKHFSPLENLVVRLIKNRYTKRKLIPASNLKSSIIIPNLKSQLLENFLKKNHTHLQEADETILVTSGVTTEKIWILRKKYPFVRFIHIETNPGFAQTVNIGFRASRGEWIGTVNDDVTLTAGWLTKMFDCKRVNTGSLNPVIYKNENDIESAGIGILKKGKAIPLKKIDNICNEVDATNAACVFYSREALDKVGLYDEKFESYLEDIDISLRLKRAGFKNLIASKSYVYHHGQTTSQDLGLQKNWFDFRNWIYIIIKNWSMNDLFFNAPSIFVERLRNLSGVLKNVS